MNLAVGVGRAPESSDRLIPAKRPHPQRGGGPRSRHQPVKQLRPQVTRHVGVLRQQVQILHLPWIAFEVIQLPEVPARIFLGKHVGRIVHTPVLALAHALAPGEFGHADPVDLLASAREQRGNVFPVAGLERLQPGKGAQGRGKINRLDDLVGHMPGAFSMFPCSQA